MYIMFYTINTDISYCVTMCKKNVFVSITSVGRLHRSIGHWMSCVVKQGWDILSLGNTYIYFLITNICVQWLCRQYPR